MPERPDDIASRWVRVTVLKQRTAADHPWVLLYDSLVTAPVLGAHAHGDQYTADIMDPVGVLERLEASAREHGLIDDAPPSRIGMYRALSVMLGQAGGLELTG